MKELKLMGCVIVMLFLLLMLWSAEKVEHYSKWIQGKTEGHVRRFDSLFNRIRAG